MKIEQGKMRITEVPNVERIDVNNAVCEITFAGLDGIMVFAINQLQEFYVALGEALKYSGVELPTVATEPRSWYDNDPEPMNVTAVIDNDGDRWEKRPCGTWYLGDWHASWDELLHNHCPLMEAK